MKKVMCSAKIPNQQERKAIMSWVRSVANGGYSEVGDSVYMTYEQQTEDSDSSGRWWGIIHVFEQYPEHSVEVIEA